MEKEVEEILEQAKKKSAEVSEWVQQERKRLRDKTKTDQESVAATVKRIDDLLCRKKYDSAAGVLQTAAWQLQKLSAAKAETTAMQGWKLDNRIFMMVRKASKKRKAMLEQYASRSLLFDLHTGQWSDELLEIFELDSEKLCPLVDSGTIIGETSAAFGRKTGIAAGIPVISAGGDQQTAALGMGVLHKGDIEVSVGTGAYILAGCDAIPAGMRDDVVCQIAAGNNGYVLESSVLTGCSAFDWFFKTFYACNDEACYRMMDDEIAQTPAGAHGVMILPYFQGRATPDWNSDAAASFHNLRLSTTRADMACALLEGLCYELSMNFEVLRGYLGEPKRVTIGGGLSKNACFNQMLADICHVQVCQYSDSEAAALGAWMCAAVALGQMQTLEDAFAAGRADNRMQKFEPHWHAEYEHGKKRFTQLYRMLNPET